MENQCVLKSQGSGLVQQHRDRQTLMEHPANPCQAPCPQCAPLMVAFFVCRSGQSSVYILQIKSAQCKNQGDIY